MSSSAAATAAIWIARGLLALVATLITVRLLRQMRSLFQKAADNAVRRVRTRGKGIALRSVEIASLDSITRTVRSFVGTMRFVATVALVYAWLVTVAFALDSSHRVLDLVLAPLRDAAETLWTALLGFVPNAVMLVLIFVTARVAMRVINVFTDAMIEGRVQFDVLEPDLALPTRRVLNIAVWLLAAVMAVPYLPGSGSKAFLGVTALAAVLVTLGSASPVANLLSGLTLTYTRAYREGDRVKIGAVIGDVVALGVLTTRVRTVNDEEVLIPNAIAQAGIIVNYSRYAARGGVQVHTEVTIAYDIPWQLVHQLLLEAARATPGVIATPEPYVLQRALEENFVRYEVCAFTDRPNELHRVESKLREAIQDSFAQGGIEMCSPKVHNVRAQIPYAMGEESGSIVATVIGAANDANGSGASAAK